MNELSERGTAVGLYAEVGLYAFPLWWPIGPDRCACWLGAECKRVGKHPLFRSAHPKGSRERATCRGECGRDGHGLWDATTDLDRITRWWRRAPLANVGINCELSTLAVLDVDAKNGGTEALVRLQKVVDLPQTIRVWTGSGAGSEHRYFSGVVKTAIAGVNRKMPPLGANMGGLDIKSQGGYVVAPPSRHGSGDFYRWADGPEGFLGEMAEWPEMLTRIRDVVAASNLRPTHQQAQPGARGAGYGQAALDGVIRDYLDVPADHGLRNDALNAAAYRLGRLVAQGHIGERAARQALEYAASSYAAKDGWTQTHWTIESGMSKGMANPRTSTGVNA